MRKRIWLVLSCCCLGITGSLVHAQDDERPLTEQPYLGISVGHDINADKCIIGWIYPGPLGGTGFTAEHNIARGDYLLAVDGQEIHTPEAFTALMQGYKAGQHIELTIQHTKGNVRTSVPTAGKGTDTETIAVTLDARAAWSGPVSWHRSEDKRVKPETVVEVDGQQTTLEGILQSQLEAHDIAEPVDKLVALFDETLDKNYGSNMLDRVAYGFRYPLRLAQLQPVITEPLTAIPGDPRLILHEAAANIDATPAGVSEAVDLNDPAQALDAIARMVDASHTKLDKAFAGIDAADRAGLLETYPELVQFVADNFYINTHPQVQRLIKALDASMQVDFDALLEAGGAVAGVLAPSPTGQASGTPVPVPEELADAISGEILSATHTKHGWCVYGSSGTNEYDMSKIAVVVDAGGNDHYRYSTQDRPRVQIIIDREGDDTYDAAEGVAGPASALFGISMLVDDAGNDVYKGASRSCGVGVMGIGVLLDRNGADQYSGKQWSCGGAFYGCGAIVDLGGGNDVYTTETFSQAIGGPRGLGVIVDQNGRDLYRNNGPVPSGYGTAAVYSGIAQGVGFGVRGYDTGGIGVLCDLAGDDRYEAGEFSQGGAYYWGLGILYDKSGRDMYYGNRYSQGFAAHQALGILADDAGDDTYWGMTAATQSGSWDICATLLIDRAGNDSYQADGLAQGGAAMQAIAMLLDLDGHDRYDAPNGATQGQSGGNSYHYDTSGCMSFSLLMDAGGPGDWYSRDDRGDGMILKTGSWNEQTPKNSSLYGLFVDFHTKQSLLP